MDHFNYQQDLLFAEGVPLSKIAEQYGTPSYVYSRATLERHAKAYTESFNSMDGLVCFSVKALSNVAILKVLPKKLDEEVAELMVQGFGGTMTKLTADQAEYINVPVDGPFKEEEYKY